MQAEVEEEVPESAVCDDAHLTPQLKRALRRVVLLTAMVLGSLLVAAAGVDLAFSNEITAPPPKNQPQLARLSNLTHAMQIDAFAARYNTTTQDDEFIPQLLALFNGLLTSAADDEQTDGTSANDLIGAGEEDRTGGHTRTAPVLEAAMLRERARKNRLHLPLS
jgi:hypothetical protein